MADREAAHILLVDDEESFLDVLSRRLEKRGYIVEKACDGQSALELVKAQSFDAIVLDLIMPGMNGHEVLKRIKQEHPEMQIILLTGKATVADGVEAIKEGAVDLLEKPFDIEKLLEIIGNARRNKMVIVEKTHEEHIKEILENKGW